MGSNSSTTNQSWTDNSTKDHRMAADGEAIVTRAGGNVTINKTAKEAVQLGTIFADTANEMAEYALLTGRDITEEGLHTVRQSVGDALYTVENTVGDSLDFADRTQSDAFRFAERGFDAGGASLDFADRNADRSYEIYDTAFRFADDNTDRSYDFTTNSLDSVVKVSDAAIANSERNLDTSLGFAEEARKDAFDFAGRSLNTVSGAFTETLEKSQEDSTQLSEKLIKLGVPALALIFIAQALRN